MKYLGIAALWLTGALARAPHAQAGIVNVQSILATEAKEGLTGAITASLDFRSGSSSLQNYSAAPVARYRHGDHLVIGVVRGEFIRIGPLSFEDPLSCDGAVAKSCVRNTFEHLRYRYTVNDWLMGESFAQHEYSERRRLQLRTLVGVGPRFHVMDRERADIGLGVAYMLEYERLADDDAADAGATALQHRISSYLTASYEPEDNLQLIETFYIQPLLTSPRDFRLLNESQLVLKITQALSLSSSLVISYDRRPPATLPLLDTAIKSSVTYTF